MSEIDGRFKPHFQVYINPVFVFFLDISRSGKQFISMQKASIFQTNFQHLQQQG